MRGYFKSGCTFGGRSASCRLIASRDRTVRRRQVQASRLLLLVALLALTGCARFFFHPDKPHVLTPQALGIAYHDVYFGASDGTRLHGWLLHAREESVATVLFLHGNAQNISTHIASVYWLSERAFDVLLVDYRGYGTSQGHPSLDGIQADAEAALRYLVEKGAVGSKPLIVFGQSLGGAVAIRLVAHTPYRNRIKALVVEGTFASYPQIAREKLAEFWLTWPLQWIPYATVSGHYDAVKAVPEVSPVPLLIIHGDADTIVPPVHASRLYRAAHEPKRLWLVPGAGHIEAFSRTVCRERLVRYLNEVSRPIFGQNRSRRHDAWQPALGNSEFAQRSAVPADAGCQAIENGRRLYSDFNLNLWPRSLYLRAPFCLPTPVPSRCALPSYRE